MVPSLHELSAYKALAFKPMNYKEVHQLSEPSLSIEVVFFPAIISSRRKKTLTLVVESLKCVLLERTLSGRE